MAQHQRSSAVRAGLRLCRRRGGATLTLGGRRSLRSLGELKPGSERSRRAPVVVRQSLCRACRRAHKERQQAHHERVPFAARSEPEPDRASPTLHAAWATGHGRAVREPPLREAQVRMRQTGRDADPGLVLLGVHPPRLRSCIRDSSLHSNDSWIVLPGWRSVHPFGGLGTGPELAEGLTRNRGWLAMAPFAVSSVEGRRSWFDKLTTNGVLPS